MTRRQFVTLAAGAIGVLAGCGQAASVAKPSSTAAGSPPPSSATGPSAPAGADIFARPDKVDSLEQELALPATILDGAKREGKLSVISSWNQEPTAKVINAFRQRYSDIQVDHQTADEEVRTVRTLTEFKAGHNRIDVAANIGGFLSQYRAANALMPLNDLPAYANYDPPLTSADHTWVGYQLQIWAAGYNTANVKPAELPAQWLDLAQPAWKGRIGLGDRPQLWVQQLWKEWGAERTTDFLKRLFANRPQPRKEGLDAIAQLMGAGEFDIVMPASTSRIERISHGGAPVNWLPLEPFTIAAGDIAILRGPNPNAAKVFVNWLISREGNDAYWQAIPDVMAHPLLLRNRKYLGIFADQIMTHRGSVQQPEDEETILPMVSKLWQSLWLS